MQHQFLQRKCSRRYPGAMFWREQSNIFSSRSLQLISHKITNNNRGKMSLNFSNRDVDACSQSQPRLCPFYHNFSPQYECPVTKPVKFNLAWLKPIYATGWAGTGGVLRNRRNPFMAHTAPAAKNVHLHPEATKMGEIQTAQTWGTAMGLWAGTRRTWQMKGAMIDSVVATVTAKTEKETKETGYDCLRRLICYIPESFCEFLVMC